MWTKGEKILVAIFAAAWLALAVFGGQAVFFGS